MADLTGRIVAEELCKKIKNDLKDYMESPFYPGRVPCLGIVRVGERADDIYYENSAVKKIKALGMDTEIFTFPADIPDSDFRKEFKVINENDHIDGILLFAPLPPHIDEKKAVEIMKPEKDLDGLNFINQAKVYAGETDGFAPCTAMAVVRMLKVAGVELEGKNVTVLGRSIVIGKPVSMLLLRENATVTICHSSTKDLKKVCQNSDIIVAAVGCAKMVDDTYVSEGTIVVDVGINNDERGHMCGDVDYDKVADKASLITPVPGGVGNVTTTILAEHLLMAAMKASGFKK